MDRTFVFPDALPEDTDILIPQRNAMVAIGALLRASLGTNSVVDGLVATPTSPASLTISIGPGSITALTTVDAAYGTLPAQTDPLVKQGISTGSSSLTFSAPGTSGQSVVYLVQASFSEVDGNPVVLAYYDAAMPSVPYLGAGGNGVAQNTTRKQTVALSVKASAPGTSPATPSADSGWLGLYVVTVPFGTTAIDASKIVKVSTAPWLDLKIPDITKEIRTTIEGAGLTWNPADPTQLSQAIQAIAGGPYVRLGTGSRQVGNQVKIGYTNTGTVGVTVDSTDQGDIAFQSYVNSQIASAGAGYVQKGTGARQLPNPVKLGYTAAGTIAATVDTSDFGDIAFRAWVQAQGYAFQSQLAAYIARTGDSMSGALYGPQFAATGNLYAQLQSNGAYAGGYAPAVLSTEFSPPYSGVQRFPNGYYIQTFGGALPSGGANYFAFPVAFPNACFCCVGTIGGFGDPQAALQVAPVDRGSCYARLTGSNGGSNGLNFIALGY